MYQRSLTIIIASILSMSAFAGDGVLFNYVLTERISESDEAKSEFGFLVDFNKEAIADLGGTAKLVVNAVDRSDHTFVSLSLYDYSVEGELILIGARQIQAPFDKSSVVDWGELNGINYSLEVKPQRHSAPNKNEES